MTELLSRVLDFAGLDRGLVRILGDFADWLRREAIPAGGLGPREGERVESRHVADSLLFAAVWESKALRPVLDVGSGVGLPGIPLAIAFPKRHFTLLDQSVRRVRLARRAVRVLGLENVDVEQGEARGSEWSDMTVVSRASLRPDQFLEVCALNGKPPELLIAGSHHLRPEAPGFETVEIPAEILDRPVWILRMTQS
jgi:16S rRNA G527 N7-methylase RsmG